MDWTEPGRSFIRAFAAILSFAGAKNLWRSRRDLGAWFLQLCPARCHGQSMFYARHAIARVFHHRSVLLPTLDRVRAGAGFEIESVRCERSLHFVVDLNQAAERYHRCAVGLHRLSAFQKTATPARSSSSKF